ncbi:hypothetical protein F1536_17280 [Achromobacter xylosoxidans]|uniref:hypothetical protein n=1 Tax=Alcaligenes xylosoxydans xylosoxydans TaxID=85698 RepID=UPI00123213E5|nr:hypothetical protein [Achromobacter xylosoxidans]KAA5923062.1 hypothetical protein F1536_17280 [Achromobacter xylosoxidans]
MSAKAIDPMGSVRIDDVRDPYRAERLRAQARTERAGFARTQAAALALAQAGRSQAAATAASPQRGAGAGRPAVGVPLDRLGDQYTAHCLRNAIQAFHDAQARLLARGIANNQALREEQAALRARADAANDLGTIQGLLPLQAHRIAAGLSLLLPPPPMTAAGAAPAAVGPVGRAATLRSATDDAGASDPAVRVRARRPRQAGA